MSARTTGAAGKPNFFMKYPMMPKSSMNQTSTRLLLTVKTPTEEMARMMGISRELGIFSMRAQIPTKGRFRISSMMLPMYMLATTAQKRLGFWEIISGPGCTP